MNKGFRFRAGLWTFRRKAGVVVCCGPTGSESVPVATEIRMFEALEKNEAELERLRAELDLLRGAAPGKEANDADKQG